MFVNMIKVFVYCWILVIFFVFFLVVWSLLFIIISDCFWGLLELINIFVKFMYWLLIILFFNFWEIFKFKMLL